MRGVGFRFRVAGFGFRSRVDSKDVGLGLEKIGGQFAGAVSPVET